MLYRNYSRATVIDHVVNHDLSMREAGQRVQPNLSRHTVASIVRTFGNENDTLLAFTVYLLYCVSLYLHSWQQPFFCKVCCHNTMQYCSFTKVIHKIYSRILITVYLQYLKPIALLVAGGECSLQNRFDLFTKY